MLARLDSRRLPGKVLRPLLGEKTIIDALLGQLGSIVQRIPSVGAPVIATTDRLVDEPIVCAGSAWSVTVARGHLLPCLRLRDIACVHPEDWLWRLNADSPLILESLVEFAAKQLSTLDEGIQVITNLVERSFPYGVSLEMFRADMIMGIDAEAATSEELEHVTPIVQQLAPGRVRGIAANDLGLKPFDSRVRLTIDDAEDAEFFGLLWNDPAFQRTTPGSVERVEYAYRKRLANAT